jgi:hypothetical protein
MPIVIFSRWFVFELGVAAFAATLALGACAKTETYHAPDADPDADSDSGDDTDVDTDSGPCVPGDEGIEFHLWSYGGMEYVPGRGYRLEDGVLGVDDWGTFLCEAPLDGGQIEELRSAALAIELDELESMYGSGADVLIYELDLELAPCVYVTRWVVTESSGPELAPPEVHDFAELVESIGDPIAAECPDGGA